jgi:hypothetical protein
MNNNQHSSVASLNASRSESVPSLFSRLDIDAVRNDQAVLVLENERGQFERDPSMLLLVPKVFGFVPFVPHDVYTQCIRFFRCLVYAPGNKGVERVGDSMVWLWVMIADPVARGPSGVVNPALPELASLKKCAPCWRGSDDPVPIHLDPHDKSSIVCILPDRELWA